MRYAFVIQKLAGIRGGAERVVVELAGGLALRGHQVSLLSYEPAEGGPGYPLEGVSSVDLFPDPLRTLLGVFGRGDRIESAESRVSSRFNGRALAYPKWVMTHGLFAWRLARWLRRNPQDAVVGFLPPAISAVAVAGSRLGERRPRLIASTHNVPDEDFGPSARWDQNPVTRRRNLQALEEVDVVTVLQPEFVEQLPQGARPRAVVVPNAVARLAEPAAVVRGPRVLAVGRLTDVKRYDVAVEAFARIADEYPDWTLDVFGDGPERPRLEDLVAARGLGGRVRIRGAIADIGAEYDTSRVLCHPARFEGFGLSVAESILHGMYVLASRECAGVDRLIVDDRTGVLVDEGTDAVDAFARGLRRLIADPPAEALRAEAAQQLADRLAPQRILDLWEQVLTAT